MNNYNRILWVVVCLALFVMAGTIFWQFSIYHQSPKNVVVDIESVDDLEKSADEGGATDDSGETTAGKGAELYQSHCLACHGTEGANGHNGPNLQTSTIAPDMEAVMDRIKNGGETMPSFEDTLDEEETEAIAAYISHVVAKSKE